MAAKHPFKADPTGFIFSMLFPDPWHKERALSLWAEQMKVQGSGEVAICDEILAFWWDLAPALIADGSLGETEAKALGHFISAYLRTITSRWLPPRRRDPEYEKDLSLQLRHLPDFFLGRPEFRRCLADVRRLRRVGRSMGLSWRDMARVEYVAVGGRRGFLDHQRRGGTDDGFIREVLARPGSKPHEEAGDVWGDAG
jgi:hypothetical protein